MKILWEELEFLKPLPAYTCGNPYECDLLKTINKYKETKYVICVTSLKNITNI